MGHLGRRDIYRELGRKVDGLTMRAPWNERLRDVLEALYSKDEAELVVRMPYGLSTFGRLRRVTGYDEPRLRRILDGLCSKGLVVDIELAGKMRYMPSPFVIGIFEYTMMRTGEGLDLERWARLFDAYMHGDDAFWAANMKSPEHMSVMRTVVHEEALEPEAHVEILDYEKARWIIETSSRFGVGVCSCRHEKHHLGTKKCKVPLETCAAFGKGVDFLLRHGFGREITKEEMLDNLEESREMGLVLNADNVQQGMNYMCHCCGDCCNLLLGIRKHGYPQTVRTSSFVCAFDDSLCDGCAKCKKACPIDAISLERLAEPQGKKRFRPVLDADLCLGCGVCALKCETGSLKLRSRPQKVIPPETTFERVILQCLEHDTLQNQLFDDPNRLSHQFMRAFVGGFLRLEPVKRAILGDRLRSRFLAAMTAGVKQKTKVSPKDLA